MLADLLPQIEKAEILSARVKISLPDGWKIATVENELSENEFLVADVEKAVFLVGKGFDKKTGWVGKTEFRLATETKWSFSSEEVVTMASQILEEHRRTFGEATMQKFQMILLPLPGNASFDRWRAETRGSTIVLLSAVIPFKSLALNRLHEQLRHEIFHFWIPNGLNLSGNYDWFYEGFTLYQALKTGVRLNYIRFEDFLNTMSRAIDAAQSAQSSAKISLLDASRERWRGGANLVYAKGMAVAFLCDAALLSETGGRESLTNVFRDLFQKHNFSKSRVDGNSALLAVLKKHPQLAAISLRLIEGAETVDVKNLQELSGLVNLSNTGFTKLAVSQNLNGRQKKVLEKLGLKANEMKLGRTE
jgi:predicted metalloprotease with PDZ domain